MSLGIYINDLSLVCNHGHSLDAVWEGLQKGIPSFYEKDAIYGGHLNDASELALRDFAQHPKFRKCDRTVHLALLAGSRLNHDQLSANTGIQIASSRGATGLWELEHEKYVRTGQTTTSASPITTLGNIGSNLSQYLKLNSLQSEQSNTCSSSGIALANAIAWLKADMQEKVIVGASEAALTPFTIAQMEAMKLLSKDRSTFPCKSLDLNKESNTLVLGEASSLICISKKKELETDVEISGIGWSTEEIKSPSFLSSDAKGIATSMKHALNQAGISKPDLIIAHAPGTILGDKAEMNAISKYFKPGHNIPVFSNKFLFGHSFGASGLLSIINACLFLQNQAYTDQSHLLLKGSTTKLNHVLINSSGFGGQAFSLVLSKIVKT